MISWLPSIPYAAPDIGGYWDPVTSTINWCEEVRCSLLPSKSPPLTGASAGLLCDSIRGRDSEHPDELALHLPSLRRHPIVQKAGS